MSNPTKRSFGPKTRFSRSSSSADEDRPTTSTATKNVGLGLDFVIPEEHTLRVKDEQSASNLEERSTFMTESPEEAEDILPQEPSSFRLIEALGLEQEANSKVAPVTSLTINENLFDTPPTPFPPPDKSSSPTNPELEAHSPTPEPHMLPNDDSSSPAFATLNTHDRVLTDSSINTARTASPAPGSSLRHWANLRQAFVSTPPPPTPPNAAATPHPLLAAFTSAPSSKQSKFARLGLRQVVEQAREIAVDVMHQFEDELWRACWVARFGDAALAGGQAASESHSHKPEREGSSGSGSGLHIPLAFDHASSSFSSGGGQKASSNPFTPLQSRLNLGLRRPPSLQVFAPSAPLSHASLRLLQQTLMRYASSQSGFVNQRFPLETEVLSVLLGPFLVEEVTSENEKVVEEERWIALAIFELLSRHWKPLTADVALERTLWCLKAASSTTHPLLLPRFLSILNTTLFPPTAPFEFGSPGELHALVHSLLTLVKACNNSSAVDAQLPQVQSIVSRVWTGTCGPLIDLEQAYGQALTSYDRESEVRSAIMVEGVVRSMRHGTEGHRKWVLKRLFEEHWPLPTADTTIKFTSLVAAIHKRKLTMFTNAALELLQPLGTRAAALISTRQDAAIVLRILTTRVLPEIQLLGQDNIGELRGLVIRLGLELLDADASRTRDGAAAVLDSWWMDDDEDGWRKSLEDQLKIIIERSQKSVVIRLLGAVIKGLEEDISRAIMALSLPMLFNSLIADPPPPTPELTTFLTLVSQRYPQQFYKPMFTCAASNKEKTIVDQLRILDALALYIPAFWVTNAEMMAVALMSDAGSGKNKEKAEGGDVSIWSSARIGQCVILLELIGNVRRLVEQKATAATQPASEASQATIAMTAGFMASLESRLAILVDAKERTSLLPLSYRLLLTILFTEMRLYTRSSKAAPWLPRVITWTTQGFRGALAALDAGPFAEGDNTISAVVDDDVIQELKSTLSRVRTIHGAASERRESKHMRNPSLNLLSPAVSPYDTAPSTGPMTGSQTAVDRERVRASLPARLPVATLSLLVLQSSLLTPSDYHDLNPLLWSQFLEDRDAAVVGSACFLLMQSAEKAPVEITDMIVADMSSPLASTRTRAIHRLGILFSWRYQILSQNFIPDRSRRRPFKLARQPLSFVATDVGTSHYVPPENMGTPTLQIGATLPPEIRRKLMELDWYKTAEEKDQENKLKLEQAPMSILPSYQVEMFGSDSPSMSNTSSPEADAGAAPARGGMPVIRRKSSGSGYYATVKRRPVFVPALVSLFPALARLAHDSDGTVASAARDLVLMLMRDDPALLCRPVLENLSSNGGVSEAMTTLRTILHVQSILPPALSHHLANHLAGFLKAISRDDSYVDGLETFAYILPSLSQLVPLVSELTVRDVRRNKIEPLLLPSGSFWFPSTAPAGPLFPQALPLVSSHNPHRSVIELTMIRTAQNLLLLRLLKRNPKEVHLVRKGLSRLFLPTDSPDDQVKPLELGDFLPSREGHQTTAQHGAELARFSLVFSRSHILLVSQIFRSLNRNLNDRTELAKFIDGINRILLAHGDDVGIVGHSLLAFMIASTRFRRLFASSAGFTLFMPAVIKVYCEAETQPGIRSAIKYAVHRFFALHDKAFVFQTLDVASYMIRHPALPGSDAETLSSNLFSLLAALAMPLPNNEPDPAAIHGLNKGQEREALITMVNERPEILLGSISTVTQGKSESPTNLSTVVERWKGDTFPLDDLVRLFLTIIAHNPTIQRAEYFLGLLRNLTPFIYHGSMTARAVLQSGVDALGGAIFSKSSNRSRSEQTPLRPQDGVLQDSPLLPSLDTDHVPFGDPSAPSNASSMRREYLLLVVAFTKVGGNLGGSEMQRVLDLVKGMLREASSSVAEPAAELLSSCTNAVLPSGEVIPPIKHVISILRQIAPLFRPYCSVVDFSGTLDAVTQLVENPVFAADKDFPRLVLTQLCSPALEACELAASEKILFSLRARASIVSLLSASVSLRGVDIIEEIEKHSPTPGMLAGVLLPVCLKLKTANDVASETQWRDTRRRETHARAWVRLLAYTMSACNPAFEPDQPSLKKGGATPDRSPSLSKRPISIDKEDVQTVAIALQVIKVIIIRAEQDISSIFPGAWASLVALLRRTLCGGSGHFATTQSQSIATPDLSPTQSRSPSPQRFSLSSESRMSEEALRHKRRPTPRVVDYLLFSTFEFICLFRSPLTIPARLWIQETLLKIESSASIPPTSPGTRDTRRFSISPFVKSRGRSIYEQHSPDGSPVFRSRNPTSRPTSTYSVGSFMGVNQGIRPPLPPFPASFTSSSSNPRNIIHLGPAWSPEVGRPNQQAEPSEHLTNSRLISSSGLAHAALRQVAVVQMCFGYNPLNPRHVDTDVRGWSYSSALCHVVEETQELMNEFHDTFYVATGDDAPSELHGIV
ncbi:hypothetical protein BOTBODRAFT_131132 [Botryobasidium botryosum FD-172 SS1]|uniref:Uncharacterized protein n=1 Tax=Botryobasidium botryosum (strain FD-172 SS1) TaxID=930990 RepID=A0A067MKY1_BOTB1|nr:hypothetical protein BOTBODRAFT_131132 [Botryobasidium botryosum FD-172 SS1]